LTFEQDSSMLSSDNVFEKHQYYSQAMKRPQNIKIFKTA